MARKKLKEETLEVQENIIPEPEEIQETIIQEPEEGEEEPMEGEPEPEQEEIQIPEPLQTFMEIYKNNDKTVVPHAIGVEIWKCWQRYVKRTDVWRGCSSCLISKIRFLKKELKKYGISL